MKKLAYAVLGLVMALGFGATGAMAQNTQDVQVNATVPNQPLSIFFRLATDGSSKATDPYLITFLQTNAQAQPGLGDPWVMEAPTPDLRGPNGEGNWHEAVIVASAGMHLESSVAVDTNNGLRPNLRLIGGYFSAGNPIFEHAEWTLVNGYLKEIRPSFLGEFFISYQFSISGLAANTNYNGTVRWTLTNPV